MTRFDEFLAEAPERPIMEIAVFVARGSEMERVTVIRFLAPG
jgi:hypothetical protein